MLTDQDTPAPAHRRPVEVAPRVDDPVALSLALLAPVLVTAALVAVWGPDPVVRPDAAFLVVVAAIGALCGWRPAAVAAAASLACLWLEFTPPSGSLRLERGRDAVELAAFGIAAGALTAIVHLLDVKRRDEAAARAVADEQAARSRRLTERQAAHADALHELGRALALARDRDEIVDAVMSTSRRWPEARAGAVVLRDGAGELDLSGTGDPFLHAAPGAPAPGAPGPADPAGGTAGGHDTARAAGGDRTANDGWGRTVLPIRAMGADAVGWLVVERTGEHRFAVTDQAFFVSVAAAIDRALAQQALEQKHQYLRLAGVMEAVLDPVALLSPIGDAQGRTADLRFVYLNEAARLSIGGGRDLVDRTVRDVLPAPAASTLLSGCHRALATGEPAVVGPFRPGAGDGTPDRPHALQAAAFGDVVQVTWRESGDAQRTFDLRRVRRELARTRARLEVEQGTVATLQQAVMPSDLPRLDRLRFDTRYEPAAAVSGPGGDWFDVFPAGGSIALVIGDVAGHGIDAVSLMTEIRYGLRSYLLEHQDPGAALAHTNRLAMGIGGFATALCALFDPSDGSLRWARAGHLPPLIGSPEAVAARMPLGGPMMGALADAAFPVTQAHLDEGEMVVLYTDGLVERRGEHIGNGIARLEGTVRRLAKTSSLDCGAVADAVASDSHDDDSCLVLAWHDG
jgi:hypothetical protein